MHFPLAVPVRYSTTTLENVRQVEVKVDTLVPSVQVHLHTLCINSQCAKWQGELEFPAASRLQPSRASPIVLHVTADVAEQSRDPQINHLTELRRASLS
jgi:hypothetical protein